VHRRRRRHQRREGLRLVRRDGRGVQRAHPARSTCGPLNAFSIGICWSSSMPSSRASGSCDSSASASGSWDRCRRGHAAIVPVRGRRREGSRTGDAAATGRVSP
jgi:hypothetical protein